jgi:glycine dehydrogenase subunit 2
VEKQGFMANLDTSRKLLLDRSVPGRTGANLPPLDVPPAPLPSDSLLRRELRLPEVTEPEIVRYFTHLSTLNFSVDTTFYPLGSCTMKYNPKVHDEIAAWPGFSQVHPLQSTETAQGALQLLHELQQLLSEITGMAATSLAPLAGAHGEFTGLQLIRAYHLQRGDLFRKVVLIPDSAHGTNPASAAMAGFQVISIPQDSQGNMDIEALKRALNQHVAGLMVTLPSTLGLWERSIVEACQAVHEAGGLVYGDGANMNALLGQVKPGHLGFDIVHLNLHKTFSTPHGGGGPGAGPVCVMDRLAKFLPAPVVQLHRRDKRTTYVCGAPKHSIGKIAAFHGNFGVLVRAYCYIRTLGAEGLKAVSENAVLNANYLRACLMGSYQPPYDRPCMHEVVFSAARQKERGVKALDIAKRLLDYGFHAPTMYFPLVVEEALMIEPTETETKETLDAFIATMTAIDREIREEPDLVKGAPHTTPVARLDEARAARQPDLRWRPKS